MPIARPLAAALFLALSMPGTVHAQTAAETARIDRILGRTPLTDGHNDWAEALAVKAKGVPPVR